MTSTGHGLQYRYFVAIYRSDIIASGPQTFVCEPVKVEIFREHRTYRVLDYKPAVLPAAEGLEYIIPSREPLVLTPTNQHLVLTKRTKGKPEEEQLDQEAAIDTAVTILSAMLTPDLFRTLLFRGWLDSPPWDSRSPLLKFVEPVYLDERTIPDQYNQTRAQLYRHSELAERLPLMTRFLARGLAEAPREEAFVWLWTALEIFPMIGTSDIAPISNFLAPYLQLEPDNVKNRLRIGWLYGMRSKLIHDGHLPLTQDGSFSALQRLESVVLAVFRHAGGLPYDGTLDAMLGEAA